MQIELVPQLRNDVLKVAVFGDLLVINGVEFDFTQLTEGSTLPREAIDSPWIAGEVSRVDGVLQVSLLLPIAADASDAARFPEPIAVTQDGPLELPQ